MNRCGAVINFAHRTFRWDNEARGRAQVHCVIVEFSTMQAAPAKAVLFDCATARSEPQRQVVDNINPYLIDAPTVLVNSRTKPLCDVPSMVNGNKPVDGGFLLMDSANRLALLTAEPSAEKFIRPFIGAQEFIRGEERWCIWLDGIAPSELNTLPLVKERVEAVRQFRLISTKADTVRIAAFPTVFGQIRQPQSQYLLVPRVSSEHR